MTTNDFKQKFINYCKYMEHKKQLKDEIDNLYYMLSGQKAIDYSKIPSTYNPQLAEQIRLDLIDKIDIKIKEYNNWNTEYDYMKAIIKKLTHDEKVILVRLLINKEGYEKLGNEFGYTKSGMWRYVESIIEGVI